MTTKQHPADGECPENTLGCICREMRRLYEIGELRLYRGQVSRHGLARSLGKSANALQTTSKIRKHEQARRCIAKLNRYLYDCGHETKLEEKILQIEAWLKAQKKAKTLPINKAGNLNRTAVLTQFGIPKGSATKKQRSTPQIKQLLDEYDITAEDIAYSKYKYLKYEDNLKSLLEEPNLKLIHGRIVGLKWLSDRLGISKSAITGTPQLNALVKDKQREIDSRCRQGGYTKIL